MLEIPLQGGSVNSHQRITVQLGENLLELHLNYLQSGQWSVNILREGILLCAGAMLEPNSNIIQAWNLQDDIGKLVFTGFETTLDNLGIDNHLVWVAPGE